MVWCGGVRELISVDIKTIVCCVLCSMRLEEMSSAYLDRCATRGENDPIHWLVVGRVDPNSRHSEDYFSSSIEVVNAVNLYAVNISCFR